MDTLGYNDFISQNALSQIKTDLLGIQEQTNKNIESFKEMAKSVGSSSKALNFDNLDTEKIKAAEGDFEKLKLIAAEATKENAKKAKVDAQLVKIQVKLNEAQSKGGKELSKYNEQLKKVRQENAKNAKEQLGQVNAFDRLKNKLKETKREYERLAAEEKENTTEAKLLLNQIRKLDGTITKINNTVRGGKSSFSQFGAEIRGVRRGFIRLAQTAGLTGGILGAVQVFKSSISIIRDFEKANADLAAVLEKDVSKIRALTLDAERLGATTANTASEITALQKELAKLGFNERQILESTEAIQQLSVATGFDLASSAKLSASALKIFQLETTETQRVVDVLAKATAKSALDMSFFETALSTVGPVANKFGFSIEDTSALLGKLADAGFDASSAATATRNILLNLADSNGDLAKSIGGPVKNLDELLSGFEDLQDSGVDLAKALELTDKRSVSAFATFLEGTDSVSELASALENVGGTAQTMADTQLATLDGSIKLLRSAWEGLIISLNGGEGFISGTLSTGIKFLADNLDTIVKVIGLSVAAWATYRTTVFLAAQRVKLFTGAQRIAIFTNNLFTGGLKKATVAAKGFNTAVKVNPFGLVLSALVLIVPLITSFKRKTDELSESQKAFFKTLSDTETQINSLFSELEKENISSERRSFLINEINAKYGEYLPNLLTEESTLNDIRKAQKLVNDQAERSLALKFKQEEEAGIRSERLKVEKTQVDLLLNEVDQEVDEQKLISDFTELVNTITSTRKKSIEGSVLNEESIQQLLSRRASRFAKEYGLSLIEVDDLTDELVEANISATDKLSKSSIFFERYIGTLRGATKAGGGGGGSGGKTVLSGLIAAQQELLKDARKLSENTEDELIIKNRKVALIEKEIKRLQSLGIENERQIKNQTELERLQKELNKLEKDKEAAISLTNSITSQEVVGLDLKLEALREEIKLKKELIRISDDQIDTTVKKINQETEEAKLAGVAEFNKKKVEDQIEKDRKIRQQQIVRDLAADIDSLSDQAAQVQQAAADERKRILEIEASNNENSQAELRAQAALGQKDAIESLQAAKNEEVAIRKEQAEEARKEELRELRLVSIKLLAAKIESGDRNAVQSTPLEIGKFLGDINSLPQFYKGTEYLTGKPQLNTAKDSYVIRAHEGERITPASINEKIGQISNEELGDVMWKYNHGLLVDPVNFAPEVKTMSSKIQYQSDTTAHNLMRDIRADLSKNMESILNSQETQFDLRFKEESNRIVALMKIGNNTHIRESRTDVTPLEGREGLTIM